MLTMMHSYNANVKELQDTPGSEYFAFLSRKAHEGALNQARIDVAEARMRGEIGEAEKEGKTKQEISKIDADTAVLETKRKAEKAKADSALTDHQTELDANVDMNKIAAKRHNAIKDAELQKQVEAKRAATELERLRANDVTKSKVARESAQENADAGYYTTKRQQMRKCIRKSWKQMPHVSSLVLHPVSKLTDLVCSQTIVIVRKQMLLSTSKSVRPRDCRRWPRDTERSSTFLVVLKPSCNSR